MLRCPSCSAPIEGKSKACEYCSAPLGGLEKHAEVEWPLRSPDAEALVAIDLRCPSDRPLDSVRKVLEDTFVALVVELGAQMSIRRVELELQKRLPARLEECYRLRALRVTAFTPTWEGGKTQRQRPLFQAKRRAPTSAPQVGDDGVREELVAPTRRRTSAVSSSAEFDVGTWLLGAGISIAIAAVVLSLLAIGVWVSHHIVLTILLVFGAIAAVAVVWATRRDGARRKHWEQHLEQKRAVRTASGQVVIPPSTPASAPQPTATPKPAQAPEASPPSPAKLPEPAPEAEVAPAPAADLAPPKPSVSLSPPSLKARTRERS